jgi:hypothetical protein
MDKRRGCQVCLVSNDKRIVEEVSSCSDKHSSYNKNNNESSQYVAPVHCSDVSNDNSQVKSHCNQEEAFRMCDIVCSSEQSCNHNESRNKIQKPCLAVPLASSVSTPTVNPVLPSSSQPTLQPPLVSSPPLSIVLPVSTPLTVALPETQRLKSNIVSNSTTAIVIPTSSTINITTTGNNSTNVITTTSNNNNNTINNKEFWKNPATARTQIKIVKIVNKKSPISTQSILKKLQKKNLAAGFGIDKITLSKYLYFLKDRNCISGTSRHACPNMIEKWCCLPHGMDSLETYLRELAVENSVQDENFLIGFDTEVQMIESICLNHILPRRLARVLSIQFADFAPMSAPAAPPITPPMEPISSDKRGKLSRDLDNALSMPSTCIARLHTRSCHADQVHKNKQVSVIILQSILEQLLNKNTELKKIYLLQVNEELFKPVEMYLCDMYNVKMEYIESVDLVKHYF